jgi:hypothetical protein
LPKDKLRRRLPEHETAYRRQFLALYQ